MVYLPPKNVLDKDDDQIVNLNKCQIGVNIR